MNRVERRSKEGKYIANLIEQKRKQMLKLECHITLDKPEQFHNAELLGRSMGFHFSKIDGDEVVGPGVKGYLTRSSDAEFKDQFEDKLTDMCTVLEANDVHWSRRKIEHIVLDERNQL